MVRNEVEVKKPNRSPKKLTATTPVGTLVISDDGSVGIVTRTYREEEATVAFLTDGSRFRDWTFIRRDQFTILEPGTEVKITQQ